MTLQTTQTTRSSDLPTPSTQSTQRPRGAFGPPASSARFIRIATAANSSSSITANHLEVGLKQIGVDQGRYMTDFDRVRDGFFDERSRRFDLTELPLCVGEDGPRARAGTSAPSRANVPTIT